MEYLKVWTSFKELLEPLNDDERGRLFTAMLEYADSGKEPELEGNERFVWPAARQSINNTHDKSEQMKANGSKPKQREANGSKAEQTEAKPSSPFDKDKVKDNIYTTTTTARAREEETDVGPIIVDPLIIKVQRELNGLTDTHYEELEGLRQALSDELVSFAIDEAVGNGVRNWAYVRKILARYQAEGVRTIGEAKELGSKRNRDGPAKPAKVVSAMQYQQRDYDEQYLEKLLGVDN